MPIIPRPLPPRLHGVISRWRARWRTVAILLLVATLVYVLVAIHGRHDVIVATFPPSQSTNPAPESTIPIDKTLPFSDEYDSFIRPMPRAVSSLSRPDFPCSAPCFRLTIEGIIRNQGIIISIDNEIVYSGVPFATNRPFDPALEAGPDFQVWGLPLDNAVHQLTVDLPGLNLRQTLPTPSIATANDASPVITVSTQGITISYKNPFERIKQRRG